MWRLLLIVLWLWPAAAGAARADAPAPGWLGGLRSGAPETMRDGFAEAQAHVRSLAPDPTRRRLAARASPEGHWTFANAAGETFTAATPDEVRRAVETLAPPPAGDPHVEASRRLPAPRLALHLATTTVLAHPQLLDQLPAGAELHVVAAGNSWRLVWPGRRPAGHLYAVMRPRVMLAVRDRAAFEEVLGLAERRTDPGRWRAIGIETGGPARLDTVRRVGKGSGRPLVDTIDADSLRRALPALSGQTAVVTGRVARDLLHYQAGGGVERSLLIGDLLAAAEAADVNLAIVRSTSPRQPGARNWLFLPNELAGIDRAFDARTLADLLDALAADGPPLAITVAEWKGERLRLEVRPVDGLPGVGLGLPGVISGVAAGVTGRIPLAGIDLVVRTLSREKELAWRLVPGVPSVVQLGWLATMLAGLLGVAPASRLFARWWPAEARAEYTSRFGWHAARAVRAALFWLLFVPVAGLPALLGSLAARLSPDRRGRAEATPVDTTPSPGAG